VQLVKVHMVGAEPAQAVVDRLADVLGAAVPGGARGGAARVGSRAGVDDQADLGGQHRALAVAARKRPADQFLVGVRTVGVGGVDQRHAQVERLVDHRDGRTVVTGAFMS
jgi:hypothetical protein